WDVCNNVTTWWPGMDTVHGLTRGNVPQAIDTYLELVHPDDRAALSEEIARALEEKRGHRVEYRVVWPDGSVHWVEGRGELTLDEQGAPQLMAGICVDITQRKRTEQNLRFVAEASAELADLGEVGATLDKVVHLAVPAFADWCAIDLLDEHGELQRTAVAHVDPLKAALGFELHRRFPPSAEAGNGAWRVIRSGQTRISAEITGDMVLSNGRSPEYAAIIAELGLKSMIAAPLTVRGKTLGAILFIFAESGRRYQADDVTLAEDIGRRAAIAIENATLYRSLRDADRRKDEFLAMLAHELRNPLAPIRAGADLLKLPIGEAGIRKTSDVISRQVSHMTGLIDDLLDVSRVTRGLVLLERAPVDLAQVATAAIEQVRPLIAQRNHALAVDLAAGSMLVEGDEKRLVQVIANLLNNAAKYTPEGGAIALALATRGAQELEIRIADNGVGMAQSLAQSAFDLFVQGERPSDRSQGGLGLGLALVKSLVELHGGCVHAHSKGAGQGSTFTVRLPRLTGNAAAGGARPADQPAELLQLPSALRILVVDDNHDAAQMLALLLEEAGHRIHLCHRADDALAYLAQARADVCLLDIGLPGMDGNALAAAIRALPGPTPALIAVTGYGQDRDRDAALAAGFDHFLVKPIHSDQLLTLLPSLPLRRQALA
ncbi:MAG TPA: ATP-binding protein, partial [Burkholderiaceae bacterium]